MKGTDNRFRPAAVILAAVCALIGVIYVLLADTQALTGDDLKYMWIYATRYGDVWHYPLYLARHYLSTNGRAGDMINVIFLNGMPRWALSLSIGVMMGVFVWMTVRCSQWRGRLSVTAGAVIIALLMLTLQWWDNFMMFVIQFNYIWATALVLVFVYAALNLSDATFRRWRWPLTALALLAGMMHEGASTTLCAGLLAYLAVTRRWRTLTGPVRVALVVFAVGASLTVLSPAWLRRLFALKGGTPDDPFFMLVCKSDYYALLLTAAIAVASLFRAGRRRLAELAHTPWLIFAVGAFTAMIVSGVSGVVGRSGWFAQIYAVIALTQWVLSYKPRLGRIGSAAVSAVLLVLTFAQLGAFLYYQRIVGQQTQQVQAAYAADPTKPVYFDYMRDKEVPWWVLKKTKGMIDEDDFWALEVQMMCQGDGKYPFVVLPTAVRDTDFSRATFPVRYKEGYVMLNNQGYHGPNLPVVVDGEPWMCVPFSRDGLELLWFTERDQDPGDRTE